MPDGQWNGTLIVFAHGYVAFNEPVAIPEDQLVLADGTSVPGIINGLGFAFAVTSYSANGLAVLPGINDLADLVTVFRSTQGIPNKVYLVGASEGGIITALSMEKYPNVYDGGIAACGPIGSFKDQINYLGNFRVVFDYFFPGLLPGNATNVPPTVVDNWESTYVPKIQAAIKANPTAAQQILKITGAAFDSQDPSSIETTFIRVLWYSAFTTNDAVAKLGGQPFDNSRMWYSGSSNDLLLNLRIKRYAADQKALDAMKAGYETTGIISRPLVTVHTTLDPIIPYWHEYAYGLKTFLNGTWPLTHRIDVNAYGHCNFKALDAFIALGTLLVKDAVFGTFTTNTQTLLPVNQRSEFTRRAAAAGILTPSPTTADRPSSTTR